MVFGFLFHLSIGYFLNSFGKKENWWKVVGFGIVASSMFQFFYLGKIIDIFDIINFFTVFLGGQIPVLQQRLLKKVEK